MGTSFYSWKEVADGGSVNSLLWTGIIGGLIVAIVITFKKEWAPFLAPAYGLLEGLFIGAISAIYNEAFKAYAPDLIMNAVGLTFGTAIAMYLLYNAGIIKATEKFKAVIITATVGIAVFYLITLVISMFGVHIAFLSATNGSMFGIIFSLIIVVIAALNLILDFDMIEQGAANGAPKYMEWYCAFGLLVTIVWLYLEILRLLAKISSRR
jgi:uncharacterized YccA/Bax inhibitor family protein